MTDEEIDAITDAQWGKGCKENQYLAHRCFARAILAAQAKQAGQTEPMEHGQARQVLDVGFKFENGVHTPTVLVGFAVNDWNARDAFAAALALPAPIEQITPENTDGVQEPHPPHRQCQCAECRAYPWTDGVKELSNG